MQTPPSFNWSFLLLSFFFWKAICAKSRDQRKALLLLLFWYLRLYCSRYGTKEDSSRHICQGMIQIYATKALLFETEPLSFIHAVTQCLAYRGIRRSRREGREVNFLTVNFLHNIIIHRFAGMNLRVGRTAIYIFGTNACGNTCGVRPCAAVEKFVFQSQTPRGRFFFLVSRVHQYSSSPLLSC